MKKKHYLIPALAFCLLLIVTGCDFRIGNWGRAKYERTVQKQASLDYGSTVIARTSSGSITVVGADVTDCNVVAQIRVRALSEETAQEIAEKLGRPVGAVRIKIFNLGLKKRKPKDKQK